MTGSSKTVVRAALVAALMVAASAGCEGGTNGKSTGPSVGQKAKQIVVVVAKKIWKFTPVKVVIEVVDAVIKIKAIIDGEDVEFEAQPLTAEQLEQAKKDGELTLRDEDGAERKVKIESGK